MSSTPSVTVVVLAYLDEPWIERSVRSALASAGVDVSVVLVDNGCTTDAVDRVRGLPGVQVITPDRNLGFTGGCNLGAAHATGDHVALLNADAVLAPDALRRMADVAASPDVGVVCASIRLADDPTRLNSAGNPLHVLGLTWAGRMGEPAEDGLPPQDVAIASGAGLLVRRELWQQLDGFADEYFAYHEDAELSWRCWQRGLRVVYVPAAVVVHRYEFSRTAIKYYLVERNRLLFVLTTYSRRLLVLLAPLLAGLEIAMLLVAVRQGWWRQKLAGWLWTARHVAFVRSRRAQLQSERTVDDHSLAHLMTPALTATVLPMPAFVPAANAVMTVFWSGVLRLL